MKKLDLSVFPKVDKSEWEILAQKQLKGENPNDALNWKSSGDISLLPYYESSDLQGLESQIAFFQSLPDHQWKLYEQVQVTEGREANKQALKALMGGCDGIIFNLDQHYNWDILLNEIDSEICNLSFLKVDQTLPEKIKTEMTDKNCLFLSPKTQSPVDQLKETLSNLNTNHSFIYRDTLSDFFLEIATVRALRFLINKNLNRAEVAIHTHISDLNQDDHQWFLNTSAGLASILGGSHSVSFTTKIGDERISRNVGNLIREESGIDSYQDQCGGSYYIEVLTSKLIAETLKKSNP
ncbi:MAG: methylmalonyl-CoA mutase family protein [Ekhidna sp.]